MVFLTYTCLYTKEEFDMLDSCLDSELCGVKVTVEVLRGDHKEKIPVVLEPKADES